MRSYVSTTFALVAVAALALVAILPAGSQPSRATTLNPAALNTMVQGNVSGSFQCHNERTFCRADVSRCETNERERQQWREQCLAPHKERYENCLATVRPNLNSGYGPEYRRRSAETMCRHLANYETKCQVEGQVCPTYRQCEQQYGACVRGQVNSQRDLPPQRDYRPPPVVYDRSPSQPETGAYRVRIKNQCSEAISVAYVYGDPSGELRKSGWLTVKAGKTKRVDDPVDSNQFAVHSTIGFPTAAYRILQGNSTGVVNTGFDAPVDRVLRGEGARTVPFELLRWPANEFNPVVAIDYCGSYRWGKRVVPVQRKARPKQDPRQAAIERLHNQVKLGNVSGFARIVGELGETNVSDSIGNTLFHSAAAAPISVIDYDVDMLSALEKADLDPQARNANGDIPLELAVKRRIDFQDYNQFDGFAPTEPYRNDILHFFVDRTEDLPTVGFERELTLLHVAALDYDAEMVEKLLARGFPADLRDGFGRLPRDIARKKSPEFHALFLTEEEIAARDTPSSFRPAQSAPCTSIPPEIEPDARVRLEQLAANGMIKLCPAD